MRRLRNREGPKLPRVSEHDALEAEPGPWFTQIKSEVINDPAVPDPRQEQRVLQLALYFIGISSVPVVKHTALLTKVDKFKATLYLMCFTWKWSYSLKIQKDRVVRL